MKVAVYPGSFDPVTKGHLDIIRRSSKLFDKILVAVLINVDKVHLFDINERVDLLKKSTSDINNIEIVCFDGLLVNFLKEKNITTIIKGIRDFKDFEYENQMEIINRKLDNKIETLYLMSKPEYIHISSSNVKQLAKFNADISDFVPETILDDIHRKIK